jgi:hypothetical protein
MRYLEHRALTEQLRALNMRKSAENPSEAKLQTTHPSGSDSANDDQTGDAVVGSRYQEQDEENDEMYPKGTNSDTENEVGAEQKDPGNNRGLHPRSSGEAPEVERDYKLNDPQDPGSSHPSGKAAATALIKEANDIATALNTLIRKQSDEFLEGYDGTQEEEAVSDHPEDASGTRTYDPDNDGAEGLAKDDSASSEGKSSSNKSKKEVKTSKKDKSAEDQGRETAEKLAEANEKFKTDSSKIIHSFKQAGEQDGDAFIQVLSGIMGKLAGTTASNKSVAKQVASIADKANSKKSMPVDDEKEEVTEEKEDKAEGESETAKQEDMSYEDNGNGSEDENGEEEASSDDSNILAEMAGLNELPPDDGAGGEVPPMMGGGGGMPPMMGGGMPMNGGGGTGLSPEEEQLLLQLLMQEGMGGEDISAYGKMSKALKAGNVKLDNLSEIQKDYYNKCSSSVTRAKANFGRIKAAAKLRSELAIISEE